MILDKQVRNFWKMIQNIENIVVIIIKHTHTHTQPHTQVRVCVGV